MAYKLFDKNNTEITQFDLQNKKHWCKDGEKTEHAFIRLYGEQLGLIINPEKYTNPYAPDLFQKKNFLADLKTQNTPFFKANKLYNLDPTYTVVFNWKDCDRYQRLYPKILIYFWIDWQALKFEKGNEIIEAKPLSGVWGTSFPELYSLLQKSPLHYYGQRVDDKKGNAKCSYVLDIRDTIFRKLI